MEVCIKFIIVLYSQYPVYCHFGARATWEWKEEFRALQFDLRSTQSIIISVVVLSPRFRVKIFSVQS